jgi:hypothetical protein
VRNLPIRKFYPPQERVRFAPAIVQLHYAAPATSRLAVRPQVVDGYVELKRRERDRLFENLAKYGLLLALLAGVGVACYRIQAKEAAAGSEAAYQRDKPSGHGGAAYAQPVVLHR